MRYLTTLLFGFMVSSLFAQAPKIEWERTFGGRGADINYDVVQTIGGNYVLVGETTSNGTEGKNGLFIILDSRGNSVVERMIASEKEEGLKKVVSTLDGNYVLAGYRSGKMGTTGWVLKVNSMGETIWEKEYGASKYDEFLDLKEANDGGLVLTGITEVGENKDVWIVKLNSEGSLEWEKSFGAGKDDGGKSIVQTDDGGYAVAGYTNSKGAGKTDVWLIKITDKGALEWDKALGSKKWEEGMGLVKTDDGGFAMVASDTDDKGNMWFVKTDDKGEIIWEKSYGGSDLDVPKTLTKTVDGGYIIGGNTRSHRMGARYTKLWLLKIDAKGNEVIKEAYYGDKWNDEAEGIIETSDGGFLVVGATSSYGLGGSDFWAFKLESIGRPEEKRSANISTKLLQFKDTDGNGVLNAGEEGMIEVVLKNEGTVDAYGIEGSFMTSKTLKGLKLSDNISVGFLKKGEEKKIAIPVRGTQKLETNKINLSIKFKDANKSQIPSIKYSLSTVAYRYQMFWLKAINSKRRMIFYILGHLRLYYLKLKNTGTGEDENVKISFVYPTALVATSETTFNFNNVEPNEQKEITFDFQVAETYDFPSIPVTCVVTKGNGEKVTYVAKLEVEKKQVVSKPTEKPTIMRWYEPDIDFYREETVKLRNEKLYIKIKVESPKEYTKGDFVVLVNGKPYRKGSKFDEGLLKPNGKNKRKLNVFTYEDEIGFENDGTYEIALQDKNNGEIISEALKVAYSNKKPNLFVLSVGTKTNLEYTMQDAKDFAELYEKQGGNSDKLFASVEVEKILGEAAKANRIIEGLEELNIKYQTENLSKDDMIILFMSSHGFILNDEFYIQGDDYQTGMHRTRAVSYSIITEILDAIPCKKLIFIDACHSGGAKGVSSSTINKAISELNAAEAGTTTIVSSDANELSYEDKAWENGAFTESIIKALGSGQADKDANGIVSVNELYSFIKKEVPNMVSTIKGQPQNPKIVNDGLKDLGIFIVE